MSLYDYEYSEKLEADDAPFYALIMAAMRRADSNNLAKLKSVFPETWKELYDRYNLPMGLFPEEMKQKQRDV